MSEYALLDDYYEDPLLDAYYESGAESPGAVETQVEAWLKILTDEQREAVTAPDGPVLVLAGAGTGKTRVLTTRIALRLERGDLRPPHFLALTFTVKAANEMKNRLAGLIGPTALRMDIGTFHSIFARAIRDCDGLAGLSPRFTILDESDQRKVIDSAIKELDVERAKEIADKFKTDEIIEAISRLKMSELPGQPEYVDSLGLKELGEIRTIYESMKSRDDVADYDDILFCFNKVLDDPRILRMFQQRWRMVLVDEYQDTNALQEAILNKLAKEHWNLTCVGDDDQSIYSFRQADVRNILEFSHRWPETHTVRLEQNFRSTENILARANALIGTNTHRLGKVLSATKGRGSAVTVVGHANGYDEADDVVGNIQRLVKRGVPRLNIAVIARTAGALQQIEHRLVTAKIPYTLAAGRKVSDRMETKIIAAYIRLAVNKADETAFLYAMQGQKTGVGDVGISRYRSAARQSDTTLEEVLRQAVLDPKPKFDVMREFLSNVDEVRTMVELRATPTEIVQAIIGVSGILKRVEDEEAKATRSQKIDDRDKGRKLAENRRNNMMELIAAAQAVDDIRDLAANIILSSERDEQAGDAVWLGTIHAAKGLEFDHVYLPAFEEGVLPSPRTNADVTTYEYQEERNLAYVAMTRAKESLTISYAEERAMFGDKRPAGPSVFLRDFEHVTEETLGG